MWQFLQCVALYSYELVINFCLQKKEPRDHGSKSMWGSDRAVCIRAELLRTSAERLRFGAIAIRALEVSQFVGTESRPRKVRALCTAHSLLSFVGLPVGTAQDSYTSVYLHCFAVCFVHEFRDDLCSALARPAAVCRGAPRVVEVRRGLSGRAESWRRMTGPQ